MAVFSGTGAVTWFVFGSVAGRVALAMSAGKFFIVIVVIAWAWAWAWAWFVFEALAGIVVGGVVWVAVGVGFAFLAGAAVWTWAVAGAVAGFIVAAVSKARKELLQSFSKSHTFMIMAGTCLSGLSLGRLLSELFF
jgi:serine/threonine-protein kinase